MSYGLKKWVAWKCRTWQRRTKLYCCIVGHVIISLRQSLYAILTYYRFLNVLLLPKFTLLYFTHLRWRTQIWHMP